MVQIAICDDDRKLANNLKLHLEQISEKMHDIMLKICIFHSGEDFIHTIEKGNMFNIVFMDIEMGEMDGVAVGHRFRKCADRDDTILIYISSYDSYSTALVNIGNVRFLRKPLDYDKLVEVFDRAVSQVIKHQNRVPMQFNYKINTQAFSVDAEQIVYLKSSRKVIELFSWNQKKEIISVDKFYSSLAEALEQLPSERFFQCERSHVINLTYVRQMRVTYFSLIDANHTHIPIGKTYRQTAKDTFFYFKETFGR